MTDDAKVRVLNRVDNHVVWKPFFSRSHQRKTCSRSGVLVGIYARSVLVEDDSEWTGRGEYVSHPLHTVNHTVKFHFFNPVVSEAAKHCQPEPLHHFAWRRRPYPTHNVLNERLRAIVEKRCGAISGVSWSGSSIKSSSPMKSSVSPATSAYVPTSFCMRTNIAHADADVSGLVILTPAAVNSFNFDIRALSTT
jgi:hypothetical protein